MSAVRLGGCRPESRSEVEEPAKWDTGRWSRRFAAAGVLLVGAVDLLLAGGPSTPIRIGSLDFDLSLDYVFGARYGLLLTGLAMVSLSRGLLHGKHNAWILAVASASASIVFYQIKHADLLGMLVAAGLVVGLVACRQAFPARSDPDLVRRGWQFLIIGEAATFVYGIVGTWRLDGEFHEHTSLTKSVTSTLRLLFLLPGRLEPLTRDGRWFIGSVRIAALTVVMVALARLVATVVFRPAGRGSERIVVERLLDGWATTSLAYFNLLDDKSWIFAPDGQAFVGYKVVGTTAVALGGPVGAPGSRAAAAQAFVEHASLNGWTPVFHQVSEHEAQELSRLGLHPLKIGEEAIIDLGSWTLEGHGRKSIRSSVRRVQRVGYRVVELSTPLDDDVIEELRDVSDDWLTAGAHRERTFTLGRFDPGYLRRTSVLAVVDDGETHSGRIVAFANILPSYQSEEGNFDMMRRRSEAPNGVMELLFVGLIEHFRDQGLHGMNLGLAPLSGLDGDAPSDRALRLIHEHGRRSFNFEGLRAFKDKWSPQWEPRFIMYRRETDLPRVATAIARAGELPDPRSAGARIASVGRRFAVSAAIVTLITWLMAATAIDQASYETFQRHFALGWSDLLRFQIWRLPTSQFLQTRPGWVLSNLILVAAFLPLAEWRLKSRWTVTVFFLADWISTLTVLVGVRIVAAMGNLTAQGIIASRDSGVSSGVWGLVGALAWRLPSRWRAWGLGALFVILGSELVWYQRMFDIQHLLAAASGVALVMVLEGHDETSASGIA